MPTISFFETTRAEERILRRSVGKGFDLRFFPGRLQDTPVREFRASDAVSVFIFSTVPASVIRQLKRLKLIATRSTGFNHIDLRAAGRQRVRVVNVPYYGENTVAEHTFGLLLSLSRNIHKAYVRTIRNDFSLEGLRGFDLKGKTIGVIGAGSIGMHVIKMARGFGMNVLAFDVRPNRFLAEAVGFRYAPLEEVLSTSHVLTLHCPYNARTHHLLNMKNIGQVRKGTLFINTARGGLISTEALHYALNTGIFAGAGLDVFEGEELLKDENQMLTKNVPTDTLKSLLQKNILLKMENVILTPHMAFDSVEAVERILETTAENIRGFFSGSPVNLVS
ncbi:MAG: NAD(P)-dependent oxidoreductase [Bacteroidota bacterium]